ncbi:type VII toxin-antitoxin system HepT family RNase toxin [Endozoicomonas sp. 8E]|uniref:type VII toxin-antitoxin system HepT family RNase toxin n=1 Tax=Endozoicomonas sp. 8E TaxID=3035692 RepID=UPI002938D07F|nr:DUF86 domain-containing protein [Endozoicomonas sp. 8E]WOG29965.1 DUF86 domain-containing protein [Endozoicomonas sp. 8E]
MDDVILNKYSIIQRGLARIEEEYVGYEDELTTNFTRQDSIILNIQRASQAALDLANRVIRLNQLGIPQGSRDSFSLLSDHGYVPVELADSMMRVIGFRNIAVHEYQKLNIDILKAVIDKHVQEIKLFAEEAMKNFQ